MFSPLLDSVVFPVGATVEELAGTYKWAVKQNLEKQHSVKDYTHAGFLGPAFGVVALSKVR